MDKNSSFLFNSIAPIYGMFYKKQKNRYREVIEKASEKLDLTSFHKVLDVGCGTGALCFILNENGLAVTVLEQQPFEDKLFEVQL